MILLSRSLVRVVFEIALDKDYRRTFVTGAGGEVAEGADEVRELPRGRALAGHLSYEILILGLDALGYGLL